MVEICTYHMSPQCIATSGNPTLYLDQPITKGDVSQLEVMSHTPLTVLMPPGWDCETIWWQEGAIWKVMISKPCDTIRHLAVRNQASNISLWFLSTGLVGIYLKLSHWSLFPGKYLTSEHESWGIGTINYFRKFSGITPPPPPPPPPPPTHPPPPHPHPTPPPRISLLAAGIKIVALLILFQCQT